MRDAVAGLTSESLSGLEDQSAAYAAALMVI